tara:strand:+ start:132 stop:815 length:684 start_codon:yes stop_codon:yes gene_type:complete
VSNKAIFFSSKPRQIAEAAVNVTLEIFGNLNKLNFVIIGDLELNENIENNLKKFGLNPSDKYKNSISHYIEDGSEKIKDIKKLTEKLFLYDIFLVGFKDGSRLISDKLAKNILERRKQKPIFFIDSGLPGNIEPTVRNINNCFLFDLNDLEQFYTLLNKDEKKDANVELDFFDDGRTKHLDPFFKKLELNGSQVFCFMNHMNSFLKKNKDLKIKNILKKFFKSFDQY